MRILQIVPALPGTRAVYADPKTANGLLTTPVVVLALVMEHNEDTGEDETWVDAVDYSLADGFVPVSLADNFLGLSMPGQTHEEFMSAFAELEAEYRAEQEGRGNN